MPNMKTIPPQIIPQKRNCLILENLQIHHEALRQLLNFESQCTAWRAHYTKTTLIKPRCLKEITNPTDKKCHCK